MISEILRPTKDWSNWSQPVTSCVCVWLQVPNTNTTLLLPPPSPSPSPPFVTTASHREHLPWAKQHLGPHINCHLMHWRLSNNTHMATACHILHDDLPPLLLPLHIAYGCHCPLLSSTTHTHLATHTPTTMATMSAFCVNSACTRWCGTSMVPFGCAMSSRWQWHMLSSPSTVG